MSGAASLSVGGTDTASRFCQVIDADGQLVARDDDFRRLFLHEDGSVSSSYTAIGIMGVQSSGKSTLMNKLFGTQFAAMNARIGRNQTTKGVWFDSVVSADRASLVLDCEGTDSGERGEDRTTFERQTALFALSLSSVLMVNLWEHDIGRYTASNYGVLRTVFEVSLSIFELKSPLVLLFVIRDHIEEDTPLDALTAKLMTEISAVWSECRKPAAFADLSAAEMFRCRFAALPHMKLAAREFDSAVDTLRQRLLDPRHPQYICADVDINAKSVPVDGFGRYVESIWTAIKANKELDLPSQRAMIATFRAEETITAVARTLSDQTALLRASATKEIVDSFSADVSAFVHSSVDEYNRVMAHYDEAVVNIEASGVVRTYSPDIRRRRRSANAISRAKRNGKMSRANSMRRTKTLWTRRRRRSRRRLRPSAPHSVRSSSNTKATYCD